jgi:hypothetical protein
VHDTCHVNITLFYLTVLSLAKNKVCGAPLHNMLCYLLSHASSMIRYPPVACFLHDQISSCHMRPLCSDILLSHASSMFRYPPVTCFLYVQISSCRMLPPRSDILLSHASSTIRYPPVTCFLYVQISSCHMLPLCSYILLSNHELPSIYFDRSNIAG